MITSGYILFQNQINCCFSKSSCFCVHELTASFGGSVNRIQLHYREGRLSHTHAHRCAWHYITNTLSHTCMFHHFSLSLSLTHTHTHTHAWHHITNTLSHMCVHTYVNTCTHCAMGTGQVKYNLMSTMYIILDRTMLHIKLNNVRSCIQLFHELVTHAHTRSYTHSDRHTN